MPPFLHDARWVDVPGYAVTRDGRVWTYRKQSRRSYPIRLDLEPRELRPSIRNRGGYLFVTLAGNGRYVHHLVAEAFHGQRPEGMEVRHLDGDATNNHASNLAWGTRSENARDRVRHGRQYRHPSPLTARQKVEAMSLRATGMSSPEIIAALRLPVGRSQLNRYFRSEAP